MNITSQELMQWWCAMPMVRSPTPSSFFLADLASSLGLEARAVAEFTQQADELASAPIATTAATAAATSSTGAVLRIRRSARA